MHTDVPGNQYWKQTEVLETAHEDEISISSNTPQKMQLVENDSIVLSGNNQSQGEARSAWWEFAI